MRAQLKELARGEEEERSRSSAQRRVGDYAASRRMNIMDAERDAARDRKDTRGIHATFSAEFCSPEYHNGLEGEC